MSPSFNLMLKLAVEGAGAIGAVAAKPVAPIAAAAAPPAKHPFQRVPTVMRDGMPDLGIEQFRSMGQVDPAHQPPSPLAGIMANIGWSFLGKQVNPRQMLGSPFTSNPHTQWTPPGYQQGRQDALRAAETFKPYEPGLTPGAQMLQAFAPQIQSMFPGMPLGGA